MASTEKKKEEDKSKEIYMMSRAITPANSSNDTGSFGLVPNSASRDSRSSSDGAMPWHTVQPGAHPNDE